MFNVAEFLRLRNESFNIENIDFEIMSLTSEQAKSLKELESYSDMLVFAADYGLAVGGKRVKDDEYMSSRLDALWDNEALELDTDPCIKYRVGEKVCEISGLEEFIITTLDNEKEMLDLTAEIEAEGVSVIDGDNLPDDDVTMGQLEDDAIAHATVSAA